jgi:hypothetical protein
MDMRFWASRAAEELMALGQLFVIARYNAELADYLKHEFAGEPVTVILDRRQAERRQRNDGPAGAERRRTDRRRQPAVDETLRARGFVVLPIPPKPEGENTGS